MKNKLIPYKKPLIVTALLGGVLVLYFYRNKIAKQFQKSKAAIATNTTNSTTTANVSTLPAIDSNSASILLQKGSTGLAVKHLQKLLNRVHKKHTPTLVPLLKEDGIFGSKTEAMLERYTHKINTTIKQLILDLSNL